MKKAAYIFVILGFLAAGCGKPAGSGASQSSPPDTSRSTTTNAASRENPPRQAAQLSPPLSDALARVTKKPFGLYVTPQDSPVSPERFTGYHTGVDFETLPSEQDAEVQVLAVCPGKVLMEKWASGYGGVMVQSCTLDGQAVTVAYGHLRLSSILPQAGSAVTAGEKIAVLGKGNSSETDGERMHLHLGIHKGSAVNIAGYVQKQSGLNDWLDAQKYLQARSP